MSGGNGRLSLRQISIVGTFAIMLVGGTLAWGQTRERTITNADRINNLDTAIAAIRDELKEQTRTLATLEERSAAAGATDVRMLDAIESLGREMRAQRRR